MFLGDLVLRIGDADFSAPWGWVPILDIVRQLMTAITRLSVTEKVNVDFTESEALLSFALADGWVTVTSTYSPAIAKVAVADLEGAVKRFSDAAINDFERICPGLRRNRVVREMIMAK